MWHTHENLGIGLDYKYTVVKNDIHTQGTPNGAFEDNPKNKEFSAKYGARPKNFIRQNPRSDLKYNFGCTNETLPYSIILIMLISRLASNSDLFHLWVEFRVFW